MTTQLKGQFLNTKANTSHGQPVQKI